MKKAIIDGQEVSIEAVSKGETKVDGNVVRHDTQQQSSHYYTVELKGRTHHVEVRGFDKATSMADLRVDGKKVNVQMTDQYDDLLKALGMERGAASQEKDLKAPMPGLVLSIDCKEGQEVAKGDALLVLEAMKMENVIKSPRDGEIEKIKIEEGKAVEKNEVLIIFK
ncbi:MAG: biotin/lipoyl-binding protein [Flavobacteriales bacterium]|nr:biotin/lipoyl-binding protein [Flavobacteriales bacterium]